MDVITIIDANELAFRFPRQSWLPRQSMTTAGQSIRDFLFRIALAADTTTAVATGDPVFQLFNKLDALLTLEDANGYVFRATPYAHQNAKLYLESIRFVLVSNSKLIPSLTPDGEGGIDIEWDNGLRQITLSCRRADNQQDFIYWQQGDEYEARDATPELLRERLTWLVHE